MKILLVTSEVTFVRENYNQFIEEFLREIDARPDVSVDLVILKNNSPLLTLKALALLLVGARSMGLHLLKNSWRALFSDRKEFVKKYKVNIHFFRGPNSSEFIKFAKNNDIDLIINARTRFIYHSKILKIPKIGSLNIHHGLLPDYRGTMSDLWALYENRPTGFSIHLMEKKIDNGAIVRRIETSISGDQLRQSFSGLIFESSKIEGRTMADVVKTIIKTKKIPIMEENVSNGPIYTKNPGFLTIRRMLQKGIKL